MIEFVRGEVASVRTDHAILDVAGIGLRLEIAPATAAALREGSIEQMPTAMVVREDSWTLYGFGDTNEREVFQSVQTVSGIGPRTAQALIGTLTADGVRQAVQSGDEKALTTAPGIGKKGAQRIILELADKMGPATGTTTAATAQVPNAAAQDGWREDVRSALVALGFNASEAGAAMERTALALGVEINTPDADVSVSEMIRGALRELNRS